MQSKKKGIFAEKKRTRRSLAVVASCAAMFSMLPWSPQLRAMPAQAALAAAQKQVSSLSGTVADARGAAIEGARIVLEDHDSHQVYHQSSAADGSFFFKELPAGPYRLEVVLDGYKKFQIRTLPLMAGDTARATIQMEKGLGTETSEGAINSVVSKSGASLADKDISDIPENQRNFVNLLQMAGGANEGNTNGSNSGAKVGQQHDSSSVSVGGQIELLNNIQIDNTDNNVYSLGAAAVHPSMEAIGGMQILGNAYSAAYGRALGGVVLLSSKAGGKKYHGNLYEFFRNDILDAYPYLFGASERKPEVRQNQFGGSLGGPLGGKTHFMGDFEDFRLIQGYAPQNLTVPTLYEHNHPGDFSDIGGSALSQSQLDAAGLKYFELLPAPNSGSNSYVSAKSGSNMTYMYDVRVDHQLTEKNSVFTRFSYNHEKAVTPSAFPAVSFSSLGLTVAPVGNLSMHPGTMEQTALNYALSDTYTLSSTRALKLYAGYTYYRVNIEALNGDIDVNTAFGQPNVNIDSYAHTRGLAPVNILNASVQLGNSGFNVPNTQTEPTYSLRGDYNWKMGRHNLSVGAGMVRRYETDDASNSAAGFWNVSDFESLLKGQYTTVTRSLNLVTPHYRLWESFGYVEDEWHATPKLTASLGLRYDLITQPTEKNNHLSNFDLETGAVVVAGQNGVSAAANVHTDYSSIEPRLGLSYALTASTTLHLAYGIANAPPITDGGHYENIPYNYSYSNNCAVSGGVNTCTNGSYALLSQGLPAVSTPEVSNPSGPILYARASNYKNMMLHQFNAGVDTYFGQNDHATVFYVGSLGRHIGRLFPDINQPAPNTADSTTVNTLRRFYSVDPNLTSVGYYDDQGSSSYSALQTSYTHSTKYHMTGSFNYTYSHSLDNARDWGSSDTTGYGAVASQSATIDYGNSDFDVRHHISGTLMYQPDWGGGHNAVERFARKGWQFNMTQVWGTGLPFTVLNTSYVSGTVPTSSTGDRLNVVGNPVLSNRGIQTFFNTSAFVQQSAGTLGNERRNQYFGPHSRHTDFSLFKNFPLHNGLNGQFRTEVFNITNSSNFASPDATKGDAKFGQLTQITMGYTPREIQFALKLQF